MYESRKEYLVKEIKKYNEKADEYHKLMIFDIIITNMLLFSSIISFNSVSNINFESLQRIVAVAYGLLSSGLTVAGVCCAISDFDNKNEFLEIANNLHSELTYYEEQEKEIAKKH